MDAYRSVKQEVTGMSTQDGAGVKLRRVLSHNTVEDFDPFLMLDAFDSTDPNDYVKGFPWHPHRGIETVTYLIHGEIEHGDSLGNKGHIGDGDCQWMTAGSGIIHQEIPQASPHMLGAQLWVNLPASKKMTDPAYGNICAEDIPIVEETGAQIKIVAGHYKSNHGAFQGKHVPVTYLDVRLYANKMWEFSTNAKETLFVYIYKGAAAFEEDEQTEYKRRRALLFTKGEKLHVKAGEKGVRFLLMMAPPLKESVAWRGPIVMNTREELNEAFRDLDDNNFIRRKS